MLGWDVISRETLVLSLRDSLSGAGEEPERTGDTWGAGTMESLEIVQLTLGLGECQERLSNLGAMVHACPPSSPGG